MAAGDYEEIGEGGWKDVSAMAEVDGRLFIISSGTLYSVNPEDGSYEQIGEDSWDALVMVKHGGRLYIFSRNGCLYRVDPASGEYEELGEAGWKDTTAAAVVGDRLFAVCNELLYAVET